MTISFDYDHTYPGPAFPVVEIAIVGESDQKIDKQTALIDTGADATIIPLDILKSINARRVDVKFARNVDGTRYRVRLYAINIIIGSQTIYGIDAVANENTPEVILGRDALNQLVVKLDGIAQETEINS